MVDIVTGDNEALYREAFCISTGHNMKCVDETVTTMSKVLACVCKTADNAPLKQVLDNMEIEVFEHHLKSILNQKECKCNNKK